MTEVISGELNNELTNDTKIYIYNPVQSKFLITNKCTMVDIGVHNKTKNPYWVFKKDIQFDIVMTRWLSRRITNEQQ